MSGRSLGPVAGPMQSLLDRSGFAGDAKVTRVLKAIIGAIGSVPTRQVA